MLSPLLGGNLTFRTSLSTRQGLNTYSPYWTSARKLSSNNSGKFLTQN